jgi:hypothetical protein
VAVRTYQAQRHKFAGPGAVAFWINNQAWPVDGIVPADQAAAESAAAAAKAATIRVRQEAETAERRANRIVFLGRKAGATDAAIRAELCAAGLGERWGG